MPLPTTTTRKIDAALKLMDGAVRLFGHPLVGTMLIPVLKKMMPEIGITEEQAAALDKRYADYEAREARARERARPKG